MPAHAPGRHRPKSDPAGAPSAKPSHNGAPRASPTRRSRSQREAVAAPPTTTAGSTAAEVTTFASGSGPAEQRAVSLALHPGVSLGPFRLGMGVTEAIELVAAEYHMFAQGQIVYDAKHAVPSDILVQMPGLGVCLRFEQVVQQLRRIDFWPSEFLTVTYKARVVMKPLETTLFEPTRHLFGPCAGEYDRASKCYLLRYPGVTLGFAVTPEQQRLYGAATTSDATDPHRGTNGGDDPVAPLMCGSVLAGLDAKLAPSPGPAPVRVRAVPAVGLQFEDGRDALFGDSCQDVVQKLGPPCSTFRPVDSAWIGGITGGSDRDATDDGGVFFNYRRLGMDVFFEPRRHRASKFVMHANVPGHYDFGVYAKCNFACEIREASAAAAASGPRVDPRADALLRSCIDAQPVAASSDEGDSFDTIADTLSSAWDSNSSDDPDSSDTTPAETGVKSKSRLRAVVHAASSYAPTMLVTPETKWSAVLRQFKLAKPVTMQPPPAPNTVNPFGATHLYNDGPFVFEVVPATGKIATVTLFGPSTGD